MTTGESDPHRGQPVRQAGAALSDARAAAILIHGRGATAESILPLADLFPHPDLAYLAPQAARNTWYPYPVMSPIEANEPFLSSALAMLARLVRRLGESGIPPERVALVGFSQGACLVLEFSARNARRYGGVVGLSGGLIGLPGHVRSDQGSLAGTPVFLGCSDVDAHIPLARVRESADVMRALGGDVTERSYPGMGHTINEDEANRVRALFASLVADAPSG